MRVNSLRRFVVPMVAIVAAMAGPPVASASTARHRSYTAVTTIMNLPESGPNGNPLDSGPPRLFGSGTISVWANDSFVRTATIWLKGPAADTSCSPTATSCYLWIGELKDRGTFTTVVGAYDPQNALGPAIEQQALTGVFKGGSSHFKFYASTNQADSALVPSAVNDPASGATVLWVEQFFRAGTVFSSGCAATGSAPAYTPGSPIACTVDNCPDYLGPWSWTYTLGFGVNAQCPNNAFRWVDNYIDRGSYPADGNIETPSTSDAYSCE